MMKLQEWSLALVEVDQANLRLSIWGHGLAARAAPITVEPAGKTTLDGKTTLERAFITACK